MFSLIPWRVWLIGALCASLAGAGGYLYVQGRKDAKAAAKAAQDAADKKTLERINEAISNPPLSDDDIRKRLRELAE